MVPPVTLKILAVDDEPLLLFALKRACKGRSLEVTTESSKEKARDIIKTCNFELFLLDLEINDPQGLDLLRHVDNSCPYIPVIIMTTASRGSEQIQDIVRSVRKHGTWYLLEKPFSLDRMIHLIDLIFRDHENIQTFKESLGQNHDREKRQHHRRPHVQPVQFSFKAIAEGKENRVTTKGILTDISDLGSGMLSEIAVKPHQVITFEDDFMNKKGIVAWSTMIEQNTCRFGVEFC